MSHIAAVGTWSVLISLITLITIPCHSPLQLLIGFESGTIVQWDLRAKKADFRIYYDEVSTSLYFSMQKPTRRYQVKQFCFKVASPSFGFMLY